MNIRYLIYISILLLFYAVDNSMIAVTKVRVRDGKDSITLPRHLFTVYRCQE